MSVVLSNAPIGLLALALEALDDIALSVFRDRYAESSTVFCGTAVDLGDMLHSGDPVLEREWSGAIGVTVGANTVILDCWNDLSSHCQMVDLLLVQQVPFPSRLYWERLLGDCLQCGYVKTGCLNPNLGRLNSGCLEGLATIDASRDLKKFLALTVRTALDGRDRLCSKRRNGSELVLVSCLRNEESRL
ncbi:hypothetical protein BASA83_003993 [Batrachochytrium salamandrivorans]|nr:hypothetical protein BASA83_003993 [Batrachochytrium salamandrivorans]